MRDELLFAARLKRTLTRVTPENARRRVRLQVAIHRFYRFELLIAFLDDTANSFLQFVHIFDVIVEL